MDVDFTLRFAGANTDEIFRYDDHVTVRRGNLYGPDRVKPGTVAMLVDENTGRRGVATVFDVVYGVTRYELNHPAILLAERSHLRTPETLWAELQRFYPDATDTTEWTVIGYRTYLVEIDMSVGPE